MLIDLQLHSTFSDGYLTPKQLAQFLHSEKIKVASLTDHNTTAGQEEFKKACAKLKIKTIPGLELYVKLKRKKFNILWFNYQDSPELQTLLLETQARRRNNIEKYADALEKKFGLKVDLNKYFKKNKYYPPINRLIDEIMKSKNSKDILKKSLRLNEFREDQIIHELFKTKNLGRLYESYIDIKRIIKLKKKIDGQIILNHPGKIYPLRESLITDLKKIGIDGIEVLSPHHNLGSVMYIQFLAKKYKLIETGGSDFHRSEADVYLLKKSWDYFKIDSELLRGVEKIIN